MEHRKAHWEAVYRQKDPLEVSWYQQEPVHSLQMIAASRISKQDAIIDVGGGASLLVDHLHALGYDNLSILDISTSALQHAQQRLGPDASGIEWLESDITQFIPPHPYALWHDRAVFHFLTAAADRTRYIKALQQGLMPGGHLIIAAFSPDGPTQCSGLDIVQYDKEQMVDTLGHDFQLLDSSSEAHQTPAMKIQHFNYFHFIHKAD